MSDKFDNKDRGRVVTVLEDEIGSKLTQVGSRQKYFKDELDNRYVVLGGIGDWHGIPDDVVDDIKSCAQNSYLVIAIKKQSTLKIFRGSMEPFLKALNQLPRTVKDHYTFNIDERADYLKVREAPSVSLDFLKEVRYS